METLAAQENFKETDLKEVKKTVGTYLRSWKLRAYKSMWEQCTQTYRKRYPKKETLEVRFPKKLNKFTVTKVVRVSPVIHDVFIKCTYMGADRLLYLRCMKEISPFLPSEAGDWGVNPISIREIDGN